jgi:CRP-like cAMP-binding protein
MTMSVEVEAFARVPMFNGCSQLELAHLHALAETQTYQPGEMVLTQGRSSQNLWIVLEGKCEVFKEEGAAGRPVVLATLSALQSFGEMSFFQSAPHSASVRAQSKVKLLRLGRAQLDELLAKDSALAYKLATNTIQTLADRIRQLDEWVAKLVGGTGDAKKSDEWSKLHEQLFNVWQL